MIPCGENLKLALEQGAALSIIIQMVLVIISLHLVLAILMNRSAAALGKRGKESRRS